MAPDPDGIRRPGRCSQRWRGGTASGGSAGPRRPRRACRRTSRPHPDPDARPGRLRERHPPRPGHRGCARPRPVRDDPPLCRRQRSDRAGSSSAGCSIDARAWRSRRRSPSTFLQDVGGYLSGSDAVPDGRSRRMGRAGSPAPSSMRRHPQRETLAAVADLVASWPARLVGIRSDAAAHRLVGQLATHPALDVATAAGLLGVSAPAARAALETLAERGVLRPASLPGTGGPGRPRRWWVAGELLDLLAR